MDFGNQQHVSNGNKTFWLICHGTDFFHRDRDPYFMAYSNP